MDTHETRRVRRRAHWRSIRTGPGGVITRRIRVRVAWVRMQVRLRIDPNPQLELDMPGGTGKEEGDKP